MICCNPSPVTLGQSTIASCVTRGYDGRDLSVRDLHSQSMRLRRKGSNGGLQVSQHCRFLKVSSHVLQQARCPAKLEACHLTELHVYFGVLA